MPESLQWKTDKAGDALWQGETFLGCIYNRDGIASTARTHGWRALAGEDLIPVGDATPTRESPDARMAARALLETHVGASLPLPTAQQLLQILDFTVRGALSDGSRCGCTGWDGCPNPSACGTPMGCYCGG
jgi:hypothetical protein